MANCNFTVRVVDANGAGVAGASISIVRCIVDGAIDTTFETTQITNSGEKQKPKWQTQTTEQQPFS